MNVPRPNARLPWCRQRHCNLALKIIALIVAAAALRIVTGLVA
jgi:hypothetical protein